MPLIPRQKREVKRPITIKLEQSLADRLTLYAEFIESSRDHAVSRMLQYVMDRDKDFTTYLAAAGENSPTINEAGSKQPSGSGAEAR